MRYLILFCLLVAPLDVWAQTTAPKHPAAPTIKTPTVTAPKVTMPTVQQPSAPDVEKPAQVKVTEPDAGAVSMPPEGKQFGDWAAFQYIENGSATCYAATKSGASFITITHRPVERTEYEFQFTAADNLKPNSVATLQIDKDKFKLFTDGNSAWIRGADNDKAIADALRKGRNVSISATTANDKPLNVPFKMNGSSLALQAINKACGI